MPGKYSAYHAGAFQKLNMIPEHKIYSIALSIASAPTANNIWEALEFNSPEPAWRAAAANTLVTQSYLLSAYSARPLEAAEAIYAACLSKSVAVLDWWDPGYPKLLREIARPPIVLYLKGNLPPGEKLAIVGTRHADRKSQEAARRIAQESAAAGLAIVSGMAVGIDREAHMGALAGNFPTVGVLANGIDMIYPAANRDLYAAVMASGNSALVSEYPPGIFAGKWTFSRRNRIISGLSRGTVVVMAGERSGALITARYAMEQNREVFACPGPVFDSAYFGCHRLIRDGAKCISTTADILAELKACCGPGVPAPAGELLPLQEPAPRQELSLPAPAAPGYGDGTLEARILSVLSAGGTELDVLIRSLGADAGGVNEALMNLEFAEQVSRNGNVIIKLQ